MTAKKGSDMAPPPALPEQPGALLSAEEYARLPEEEGWHTELVEGRVVRMPLAGYDHDTVVSRLTVLVGGYIMAHDLGEMTLEQSGYLLSAEGADQERVRAPDFAFVRKERIPKRGTAERRRYPRLAPDLAAEVVSPSESVLEMAERAQMWLAAGVRLVWVIWPETQHIQVWRPGKRAPVVTLGRGDALDGLDVLPGFTCPVASLFPA